MKLKKRSEPKFISSQKAAEVFADMQPTAADSAEANGAEALGEPGKEEPAPEAEAPLDAAPEPALAAKSVESAESVETVEPSESESASESAPESAESSESAPTAEPPLTQDPQEEAGALDVAFVAKEKSPRADKKKYGINPVFLYGLFFYLSIFFLECVLKVYVYGVLLNRGLLLMAIFTLPVACIFALFTALAKGKIVPFVLLIVTTVYFMVQTVYHTIFATFFTLYSFTGAGDVSEFWQETLHGMGQCGLILLFLLLPLLLLVVFYRFWRFKKPTAIWIFAVLLVVTAAFQVLGTVLVYRGDDEVLSEKYLYTKTFIPTLSVNDFGALTTLRLDLKNLLFGMADADTAAAYEAQEAAAREAADAVYGDNVLDIDFAALAEKETNATLKDMDEYFATVTPTAQNAYTGAFQGKNLIWIVAEGFSGWALNEELTPTLYKLAHESFVFENYYNPIWGVSTSDGEYTACTGLLPKTGVWSMSLSAGNDMAFCLGNQLGKEGYLCNAYHNHTYTYYNRDESHPNLGYHYYGKGNGLKITSQWPESDVEMMENTVNDYSGRAPFHVYYMTVSGHLEYNFDGNRMAQKHEEDVAKLPLATAGKAYIACQMEFDQSIAYLIDALSEAGVLDDTLIVISGDHYPYGLTTEEINELNGAPVEQNFELYRSTLILWNSVLAKEEPVIVEKPCYAPDILPTLSNLFGVAYDSRLLMGRDILSTASPLVVFANHSWLTDQGRYNAVTREFTAAEGAAVADEYVQNMMDKVNSMFSYSAKILENDYYASVVPGETAAAGAEATTE